jgi:RimK-like ATP-grasp domain
VILLCGIPSERGLSLIADELDRLRAPFVVLNQRQFAEFELHFEVVSGAVGGVLYIKRAPLTLPDVGAAYVRLMDYRALPELRSLPPQDPARVRCRTQHETLDDWLNVTPARVINRPGAQGSNGSKPYQAQLIVAAGLPVPATLITDDPDAVRAFRARHGRVVYKSISGVRSIVRELRDEDLVRLGRIRWCPTQFQERIEGTDVRVHCVGEEAFATAVRSGAADYRYAAREEEEPHLEAVELSSEVIECCLRLTGTLGLEFAGIDLRFTPAGEVFCFEVNPSPAFSYYEDHTGQPIGRAVARHLTAA